MKLTDRIVAALELPPGKNELFAWDDTLPGFGIRLRGGRRLYYVQYRVGRRQRRESLGDVRKIKLEAARAIARARFAQVELGADPAADRTAARVEAAAVKLTFGTVADRYLKAKKDTLRPTSYSAAVRYYGQHWKALRGMPIGTIQRVNIAAELQVMKAERGKVSAARARSNLSALFSWAIGEGLVENNPVTGSNIPDVDVKSRKRVLSDEEIRAVWSACADDDFGYILRLLILTGCRRSEIGDLRYSELNLEAGILSIPGERIKNGETLTLTLPPVALDILQSVPRRSSQRNCVFGNRGKGGFNAWSYATIALNSRITSASGRALPPWSLHDIRRTVRSGLGRIGIRPDVAERVIGHAPPKIQEIYDKYKYEPEIAQALARWADHVLGIVEGRGSKVIPLRA
jgi:integrase